MDDDLVFSIQVTVTDRSRNSVGGFNAFTTTVDVLADNDRTAQMIAAQIVHSVRTALDPMVLATSVVGVVA